MKKHWRGLQNQALQTFGPDPVSDQIFGRFWEQIGGNYGSKIEQKTMATAPSPRHKNRGYGQFDATVTVDVLSNSPIFVGRCTRKRRGWAAAATEPSASTMCRPERCTSWSTSSTTSGTTSSWTSTTLPSITPLQSPGSRSRLQAGGREGP